MSATINLTGPSETPGAPQITPNAVDLAVNAAFAQTYASTKAAIDAITSSIRVSSGTGIAVIDVANLQAAFDAVPAAGGKVVTSGNYLINQTIWIKSNTIWDMQHSTTVASASPYIVGPISSNPAVQQMFANVNWNQGSTSAPVDHDIAIINGTFDQTLNGQFHAIFLKNVNHFWVRDCVSIGGGNLVSAPGCHWQFVDHCVGTDMGNALAGTYDSPTNIWYCDNYVTSKLYGFLLTGTDVTATSAGVCDGFHVSRNIIKILPPGALTGSVAIWAQGIGALGSGASNGYMNDNDISIDAAAFLAIKISGTGTNVSISGGTIRGGAGQVAITSTFEASGGIPAHTKISNIIFDNYNSGTHPLIQLGGAYDSATNLTVIGGTYSYGVAFNGGGNFTGDISGTTLNVTTPPGGSDLVAQGMIITGSGVSTTTVVRQLTGSGGVGTYQVDVSQTVASGAMSANANQYAADNKMGIGSSGYYLLGGNGWTLVDPDKPIPWTPSLKFGGADIETGGGGYVTRNGHVYYNGKIVTILGEVVISSKGTLTGAAAITGIPFGQTVVDTSHGANLNVARAINFATITYPVVIVSSQSTQIVLLTDLTQTVNVTDANFSNTSALSFNGSFTIA